MPRNELTRRTFIGLVSAAAAVPVLDWTESPAPVHAQAAASAPKTIDLVFYGPGYIHGEIRSIGIAPNGDLWVGTSGSITIFDPTGTYKAQGPAGPGQVNSITWDAKGVPAIGANDGDWARLEDGRWKTFGGFGSYSPWEVAADPDGFVYATDGGSSVVKKFNSEGTLLQVYKTEAAGPDAMVRPYSVTLDPQGRVYVSDERKPGLWIFENSGKFIHRLVPDLQLWRLRYRPEGLYATTNGGVAILDPVTGAVKQQIPGTPGGQGATLGFAVAADGSFYVGSQYRDVVERFSPGGKVTQTIGPSYKATLTLPQSWTSGQTTLLPLKIETVATHPVGKIPPVFSIAVQPVVLQGEPDSNWANFQGAVPDPAWWEKRQALYTAQEKAIPAVQAADSLQAAPPADLATNIYRLMVRADSDTRAGTLEQSMPVRMVRPGAAGSLSLYVPRERSVFQQGEALELNVIFRGITPLNNAPVRFSLVRRIGESLDHQPAASWKELPGPTASSQTLAFEVDTAALHPGRYLLQADYGAGAGAMSDVWPLQVVTPIQPTRFRILFPEWSAGYTDIWGPYTGKGMRADAANLAAEGILLYDTSIVARGENLAFSPVGPEANQSQAAMDQAAADPALPAAERFMVASPLEIELQEALRNGMQVQRDFWGTHFLNNWGMDHPLGIERDNRIARLYTQWQREWPSWIGHRYLTLSIDDPGNPEREALIAQLKVEGIVPPTEEDLTWARNGAQRQFISDAPAPVTAQLGSCGSDRAGNVYICSRAGILLKYGPDGTLISKVTVPGPGIDMYVTPDGTVYLAHDSGSFSVTTPDGKSRNFPVEMGAYGPRGIWVAQDGTILLSDYTKSRVRRYSADGKWLNDIGSANNLGQPCGVCTLSDGTIYVADGQKSGLMVFKADGAPVKFLPGLGSNSPGGKMGLHAGPDDTLWITAAWGSIVHADRTGKVLDQVARGTFAPGGLSLPTSVWVMPGGNLLVADVALPYVQQLTPRGDPVHLYGLNKLFLDVRIDRQRYTWNDRIIVTVWKPIPGQEGEANFTLLAAVQQDKDGPWQGLVAQQAGAADYIVQTPMIKGAATLRLVWGPVGSSYAGSPNFADFTIQIDQQVSPADATRLADITQRQQAWKQAWARTRMGTLVRWTRLSDEIRPGTQNTAPTNYGTPDTLAEGVWVPYRRDAVVAECENVGHDHGSYPLMGPWYLARAQEGPSPKPVWCSLLDWYWGDDKTPPRVRPLRDVTLMLGAGASGIGTGKAANRMNEAQRTLHRRIVDRLRRLGEACMALEPAGSGGVAVLHSFTQEAMDANNDEQFFAAHAAWYDLLRAHIPTAVVSEEAITLGALPGRFKAVLLPYIQYPLSDAVMAALETFQKAGGEVWLDLGCRVEAPNANILKTRYRPFYIEDAYFWIHDGYGVGAYDGNYEYFRMRQGSNERLPAIREAFGKLATSVVSTEDPDVFIQARQGGDATYIFASNDHFPDKPLYQTWLAADAPVAAAVPFTFQAPVIYNAFQPDAPVGTLSGVQTDRVEFTDAEPSRVWVTLPRAIHDIALTAVVEESAIRASITVRDAAGGTLTAVLPLEIIAADPAGQEQYHLWRATAHDGVCQLRLPVRWMAPQGVWSLTVRELITGKTAAARLTVAAALPARIARRMDPALVFDGEKVATWLRALVGQELWIPLDANQQALRPDADNLAADLGRRGIQAKVINIADMPEIPLVIEYQMDDAQKAALARVRAGLAVGMRQRSDDFRTPGPQRVIMRPLLLLGDPAQNRWLADIHTMHLVRRPVSPGYPGPGRALVQYVWTPFYDGFDAVTISATDVEGVKAGVKAMGEVG